MPDENEADEIINRIRRNSVLSDSRGRKLTLPEPQPAISPRASPLSRPQSFKKGGTVKRTGLAKLHKGELVLTKKKAQALKIKLRKKKKTSKKQIGKVKR
jgi:hypothetical protein